MILAGVQARKKVIMRLTRYLMRRFVLFQSEVLLYKAVCFEYQLACVAGVNGEGEGEREKNGVLRARDEGTPATKTPIFSSPPTDFYVTQLS